MPSWRAEIQQWRDLCWRYRMKKSPGRDLHTDTTEELHPAPRYPAKILQMPAFDRNALSETARIGQGGNPAVYLFPRLWFSHSGYL